MTDRELLERAAEVIGCKTTCLADGRTMLAKAGKVINTNWNPIKSDGDAFRLAVTLRMTVDVNLWQDSVQVRAYDKLSGSMHHVIEGGELMCATRRVIVRAAAAMAEDLE